jgi:hypothetical protein
MQGFFNLLKCLQSTYSSPQVLKIVVLKLFMVYLSRFSLTTEVVASLNNNSSLINNNFQQSSFQVVVFNKFFFKQRSNNLLFKHMPLVNSYLNKVLQQATVKQKDKIK